jgi:hypothetical protein
MWANGAIRVRTGVWRGLKRNTHFRSTASHCGRTNVAECAIPASTLWECITLLCVRLSFKIVPAMRDRVTP